MYSQNLINELFRYPYTRIESLRKNLGVTRPTATKYLNQMQEKGFVSALRAGRNLYYINRPLCRLLTNAGEN
ncbi:MAG: hypothetical protein OXI60_11785 [Acidiferrobacterales bacterium]|nr:hypothetical protein [Acidiferrobacterales bacterium]